MTEETDKKPSPFSTLKDTVEYIEESYKTTPPKEGDVTNSFVAGASFVFAKIEAIKKAQEAGDDELVKDLTKIFIKSREEVTAHCLRQMIQALAAEADKMSQEDA
jgi:head-tail adaptor